MDKLSTREKEVVKLVAIGFTNQEIADTLAITYNTAKNHVYSIMHKCNVRNRTELARMELEGKA